MAARYVDGHLRVLHSAYFVSVAGLEGSPVAATSSTAVFAAVSAIVSRLSLRRASFRLRRLM